MTILPPISPEPISDAVRVERAPTGNSVRDRNSVRDTRQEESPGEARRRKGRSEEDAQNKQFETVFQLVIRSDESQLSIESPALSSTPSENVSAISSADPLSLTSDTIEPGSLDNATPWIAFPATLTTQENTAVPSEILATASRDIRVPSDSTFRLNSLSGQDSDASLKLATEVTPKTSDPMTAPVTLAPVTLAPVTLAPVTLAPVTVQRTFDLLKPPLTIAAGVLQPAGGARDSSSTGPIGSNRQPIDTLVDGSQQPIATTAVAVVRPPVNTSAAGATSDTDSTLHDLSEELMAALDGIGRPTNPDSAKTDAETSQTTDIAEVATSVRVPTFRQVIASVLPAKSSQPKIVVASLPASMLQRELAENSTDVKRPVSFKDLDDSRPAGEISHPLALPSLNPVSGTFTSSQISSTISEELRQPLSSQVSQVVLDRLERGELREAETITVRLDPPELGEMVIELKKTHEGLTVRVSAREAVTMDMLLARGSEIESQLRTRDLDLKTLEFLSPGMSGGGGSERQQGDSARSADDSAQAVRRMGRRTGDETGTIQGSRSSTSELRHALSFRA